MFTHVCALYMYMHICTRVRANTHFSVLELIHFLFNPLSANPIKWPNTLKQFVGKLPTNCLSVFGHFVNLALKGLTFNTDFILSRKTNELSTNTEDIFEWYCFLKILKTL